MSIDSWTDEGPSGVSGETGIPDFNIFEVFRVEEWRPGEQHRFLAENRENPKDQWLEYAMRVRRIKCHELDKNVSDRNYENAGKQLKDGKPKHASEARQGRRCNHRAIIWEQFRAAFAPVSLFRVSNPWAITLNGAKAAGLAAVIQSKRLLARFVRA